MDLFDNHLVTSRILQLCSVEFLWNQYKLFGRSPFCHELTDKHIIKLLCDQWQVKKTTDFLVFVKRFDKKYFLSCYTSYEYRRDRLKQGFGINRLFIYSVVSNWEDAINKLATFQEKCSWAKETLFEYCYYNPEYLSVFYCRDYHKVLIRALRKGFSDEQLNRIREELKNATIIADEKYYTVEDLNKTFSLMVKGYKETGDIDLFLSQCKEINKVCPDIILYNFSYNPYSIKEKDANSFKYFAHYIDCTKQVCDRMREINYIDPYLCNKSIEGIKLLIENNIVPNNARHNILCSEWLYDQGIITESKHCRNIGYCNGFEPISPDDIIRVFSNMNCKNTRMADKILEVVESIIS